MLDAFLDWVKANKAEKTYLWHKNHIQAFCDDIPRTLTIDQLKPFHLTRIMDGRKWAPSTKNGFGRSVQRAIRWANRQGIIDRNPIAFVEKPGVRSTGKWSSFRLNSREAAGYPCQTRNSATCLITAWETGCRCAGVWSRVE